MKLKNSLRESNYSLWGLLANAGYITIIERIDSNSASVRIPNDEVMAEFQMLITHETINI